VLFELIVLFEMISRVPARPPRSGVSRL